LIFGDTIVTILLSVEGFNYKPVGELELFTNEKWYVTVNTVEELINELKLLPPMLPVKQGNDGVDVVMFNRERDDEYLTFEEGGEWIRLLEGSD